MKAMLYADWMNFRQSMKSMLFVLVVFAITAFVWSGPMFFNMSVVMLAIMVPQTMCSVDKAYGWDKLSLSMPVLRRDVVGSKFLLCMLNSAAVLLVCVVLTAVYAQFHVRESLSGDIMGLVLCESVALVLMGIMLVTTYKWGVEKARYLLMACVWIPIISVFLLRKVDISLPDLSWLDRLEGTQLFAPALVLLGGALLVYVLCYLLSVHVYKKTEL